MNGNMQSYIRSVVLVVQVIFVIAGAGLTSILTSCSDADVSCQNEVLEAISSPDGKLSAVSFSRNCGATTGENIQVSIVERGADPRGKGNSLIMDQAPAYADTIRPIWADNNHLVLTIPTGARVFQKSSDVRGVRISFRKY